MCKHLEDNDISSLYMFTWCDPGYTLLCFWDYINININHSSFLWNDCYCEFLHINLKVPNQRYLEYKKKLFLVQYVTIAKKHLCSMDFIRKWMPILTFLFHEEENQLHVQVLSLNAVHALWPSKLFALTFSFLTTFNIQQNGIWVWFEHSVRAQCQIKQLCKCEVFPNHLVLSVCRGSSFSDWRKSRGLCY